jgi:hypothetical protein
MDLVKISEEIRDVLEVKRKELELTFIEEDHIYYMRDVNGKLRNNYPSVSKIIKNFYVPFDADTKALQMAKGDVKKQKELLEQWKASGEYSTNMGSRVHYLLETETIARYGSYKDVREPIFDCDHSQIVKSDKMIEAGNKFLDLMAERNAILLDTEMVLGDPELGYTGQPDKMWLMMNKLQDGFGIVITDWKTNQPKNFKIQPYTGRMLHPFENYHDTALGHYFLQLPLYGKLLLKMLQGSKYENIKLYGCIIVHLKDDSDFEEFRVPREVIDTILEMDMSKYLTKKTN